MTRPRAGVIRWRTSKGRGAREAIIDITPALRAALMSGLTDGELHQREAEATVLLYTSSGTTVPYLWADICRSERRRRHELQWMARQAGYATRAFRAAGWPGAAP